MVGSCWWIIETDRDIFSGTFSTSDGETGIDGEDSGEIDWTTQGPGLPSLTPQQTITAHNDTKPARRLLLLNGLFVATAEFKQNMHPVWRIICLDRPPHSPGYHEQQGPPDTGRSL